MTEQYDIDQIRQSPRQFVELQCVEWLSDKVVVLKEELSKWKSGELQCASLDLLNENIRLKQQLAISSSRHKSLIAKLRNLLPEP
jgi:hypothetical protein